MMLSTPRLVLIAAPALLTLIVGTTPVMAAGLRIMIVYGRPLARPVIMSNWGENEGLMVATNDGMSVMHARLRGRPSFRMALFWGEQWVQYMKQHRPLSRLRPSEADQFARFYPAYGAAPPLLVFDSIPGPYMSLIRRVGPDGLAILARHGIPIRLPVRGKASSSFYLQSFARRLSWWCDASPGRHGHRGPWLQGHEAGWQLRRGLAATRGRHYERLPTGSTSLQHAVRG